MSEKIKAIVLDPDEDTRYRIGFMASRAGCRVIGVASTNDEARRLAAAPTDAELIITHIPMLDVFSLAASRDEDFPEIGILAIASDDDDHTDDDWVLDSLPIVGVHEILGSWKEEEELEQAICRVYEYSLSYPATLAAKGTGGEEAELTTDKPQIFVSYCREDWDEYAEPLVAHMRQADLCVWVDQHLLQGGDDWLDKINEALSTSAFMILCISPDALQSKYVKMEYRYFFVRDKPIIPVMCRPVDRLPAELQIIQYQPYNLDALVKQLQAMCGK